MQFTEKKNVAMRKELKASIEKGNTPLNKGNISEHI
jgi:hypothetical protein